MLKKCKNVTVNDLKIPVNSQGMRIASESTVLKKLLWKYLFFAVNFGVVVTELCHEYFPNVNAFEP